MKWILAYAAGTMVLLAPIGVRLWMRAPGAPASLDATAVAEGKMLFTHEWTANDPLSASGDGLGPVYNATSCVQCHFQGGLGGSGGLEHNVTTFFIPDNGFQKAKQGVVHAHAISPEYQENLMMAHAAFPPLVRPTLAKIRELEAHGRVGRGQPPQAGQRNTPALFGAKLIDDLPEQVILANERSQKLRWRDPDGRSQSVPAGRALIVADGRIGKFGWKAQSSSLLSFVQAACANELGLGNPGQAQPIPLSQVNYVPRGLDLTAQQCEQMTAFIAALPRPVQQAPGGPEGNKAAMRGRAHFHAVGCAECHVPDMGSLEGVYSDFLLHRMGDKLEGGGGSYNPPVPEPDSPGNDPMPDEWRTPPLWGVADSAPYLHDGRAPTLQDAIMQHGGQAGSSLRGFQGLTLQEQSDLLHFLKSLRAPGAAAPAAGRPI